MNNAILYDVTDGIALITMNRPERMNAVNFDFMVGFLEAVQRAADDEAVRCVVLTGAGRGFCAGGDRKEGASPPADWQGPQFGLLQAVEACRLLREMPKPTIAMINGAVAGAGVGIAGSCDLRFAGKSAVFFSAFDNIGSSGDYGSSYTWTRALGAAKAREIFLLGEKFSADEGLAFGLYTRVYADEELREKTMEAAHRLVKGPRRSWAGFKANINAAEQMNFREHLEFESTPRATPRVHNYEAAAAKKD